MTAPTLSAALADLSEVAVRAGLDPIVAVDEGRVLAAAIAESNPGAYVDWCHEVGVPPDAASFIDAAMRGRRYRGSPTPGVSRLSASGSAATRDYARALAEVCASAALLGVPGPQSTGAAQLAAAAQLGADRRFSAVEHEQQAQREFTTRAPAILADVLHRLAENQARLLDLRQVDPRLPGAIGGLGSPVATAPPAPAPAVKPAEPQTAAAEVPAKPERTVEELLAELDDLVGLTRVKAEIHRQTAILRVDALRTKAGLKSPTITRHLIFTGNPGTGKTTVARLVSGIYKAIGLLSKGQLVEVDRSELVAGYLGQTAIKTAEVVAKAVGGVLFIDEAYALSGDQYGEEAINTLVKEMEDKRDDLVVIVAGYPGPMAVFIAENPGLSSRFRTTIQFDDYSDDELVRIFTGMATKADYDLGPGCTDEFRRQLSAQVRDETFGNGRFARNVFEAAIGKHAWRLRDVSEPTLEQLRTLLPEDLTPDPEPAVPWPSGGEAPVKDSP